LTNGLEKSAPVCIRAFLRSPLHGCQVQTTPPLFGLFHPFPFGASAHCTPPSLAGLSYSVGAPIQRGESETLRRALPTMRLISSPPCAPFSRPTRLPFVLGSYAVAMILTTALIPLGHPVITVCCDAIFVLGPRLPPAPQKRPVQRPAKIHCHRFWAPFSARFPLRGSTAPCWHTLKGGGRRNC
jgi:hypothetical protein